MSQLKVGGLEVGRQVGVGRLLDHPGAGEADLRLRFRDVDVAKQGERGRRSAIGRVGEDAEVRQAGRVEPADGPVRLGHLHQRQHALLHPGTARGGDQDVGQALGGGALEPARKSLAGHDAQGSADEPEVEHAEPDGPAPKQGGPCPDGFVEALVACLLDRQVVRLRHLPVEQVMGADVRPALVPGVPVGEQRDPGVGPKLEVVPAVADIDVRGKLLAVETDAAAWAVAGERDLRQRPAREGNVLPGGPEGEDLRH